MLAREEWRSEAVDSYGSIRPPESPSGTESQPATSTIPSTKPTQRLTMTGLLVPAFAGVVPAFCGVGPAFRGGLKTSGTIFATANHCYLARHGPEATAPDD